MRSSLLRKAGYGRPTPMPPEPQDVSHEQAVAAHSNVAELTRRIAVMVARARDDSATEVAEHVASSSQP